MTTIVPAGCRARATLKKRVLPRLKGKRIAGETASSFRRRAAFRFETYFFSKA